MQQLKCFPYINNNYSLEDESTLNEVSEIYTYDIYNEHDKIIKDILNDREEARKFINSCLKLKIPLKENQLELYNSSFISSLYQNKEADIVYKKTDQNIFFLIEHQSSIDLSMPYRIENYTMEIINMAVDKEKMKRKDYLYPRVISIVLYTGKTKWNANLTFSDVQEKLQGYEAKDRGYIIIDINDFNKNTLLEDNSFISKVLLLESSKTKHEFLENARLARRKTPKNKLEQMDKILSVMLSKQIGQEDGKRFLDELKIEGGNSKMELAVMKMFETENKKIFRQGRKEGKKETAIEIAVKMLKENVDIDFINRMTGLHKDEIKKLDKSNN